MEGACMRHRLSWKAEKQAMSPSTNLASFLKIGWIDKEKNEHHIFLKSRACAWTE